jgi:hypothetical protein
VSQEGGEMKTIIIEKPEQEMWRDGTPMMCSICGQPILRSQPRYATISQSPKKRDASHYFCQGGLMTIIGSPEPNTTEISQYSGRQSK